MVLAFATGVFYTLRDHLSSRASPIEFRESIRKESKERDEERMFQRYSRRLERLNCFLETNDNSKVSRLVTIKEAEKRFLVGAKNSCG